MMPNGISAGGVFVDQQGGKFAYVVEDGYAYRRPIVLGATSVDKRPSGYHSTRPSRSTTSAAM